MDSNSHSNGGVVDRPQEVSDLLKQITEGGVGTRSRWAIRAAADAAKTEGIAGVIVITIPPKCKDFVDVSFTVGMVEVVSRWAV